MLPLNGILVLDLCRGYPGAISAMHLGDFGADVIRIDPPRGVLPPPPAEFAEEGERYLAHRAINRNKKSIVLNLKNDEGRHIFYKLIKQADVLVECFRPGVMKGLKADYSTVKDLNPALIYCSLTGYGHDGPYAATPGHDMTYSALGGVLSLIGPRDGPPYLAANFLADVAGSALHGSIGILLALMHREKTGKGQFVDISFLDGVVALLVNQATDYFARGMVARRGETVLTGGKPYANIYKCKDGEYISIACIEPHFWKNLCQALGKEELIPYHEPAPDDHDNVVSALAKAFLSRTRNEWFELLKDKEVCIAPVYYLNETFADPHVLHRNMVVEIENQKLGKVRQVGIPIKLSDTPGQIRSLGTVVGSNTEEVLLTLGYDREEIEGLRQAKAIE